MSGRRAEMRREFDGVLSNARLRRLFVVGLDARMKSATYWDEEWIREELAGEGAHDRLAFYRRIQADAIAEAALAIASLSTNWEDDPTCPGEVYRAEPGRQQCLGAVRSLIRPEPVKREVPEEVWMEKADRLEREWLASERTPGDHTEPPIDNFLRWLTSESGWKVEP